MEKRGAYFFVIDVFVASTIIIIALLLMFNFFLKRPEIEQPKLYAEDLMNFLLTTENRNLQSPYRVNLTKNGNITDQHQSLFNQILEFHLQDKNNITRKFIGHIAEGLIPRNYGIEYTIDGVSVYNKSLQTRNSATFSVSSKKLGFLRINRTSLYGPVICEVQIWD